MFVAMIWFNKPDDFCLFGPFFSYDHARAFADWKVTTYHEDVLADVHSVIEPFRPEVTP